MKKQLKLPKFKNEDEEREFWASVDPDEYFEVDDFEAVSFPNLKPTSRPVSIRLPLTMIAGIKEQANAIGVPYQSLMKMKLSEILQDNSRKM